MSDPSNGEETVSIKVADVVLMVVHLTNAVMMLNSAAIHLASDDRSGAIEATREVSTQVDEILDLMRELIGKDVPLVG